MIKDFVLCSGYGQRTRVISMMIPLCLSDYCKFLIDAKDIYNTKEHASCLLYYTRKQPGIYRSDSSVN